MKQETYANIYYEMSQYLHNYIESTFVRKYIIGSMHFELCQFIGLPEDVGKREKGR